MFRRIGSIECLSSGDLVRQVEEESARWSDYAVKTDSGWQDAIWMMDLRESTMQSLKEAQLIG